MTNDLQLIPTPAAGSDLDEPGVLSDDAKAFIGAALAPTTLRAYRVQWKSWVAYAEAHGLPLVPASQTDVANWLTHRAVHGTAGGRRGRAGQSGHSLATIRSAVAAVATAHELAGQPFESKSPVLKNLFKGMARTRVEEQEQAPPLRADLIAQIIRQMGHTPKDLRDAALLAVGYLAARRRSELVGLDWHNHGTGDGYVAVDTDKLRVVLIRHKTRGRQTEPQVAVVPRAENARAIAALERWVAVARIQPGAPLFVPIAKGGKIGNDRMTPYAVSLVIKRRVAEFLMNNGTPREVAEAQAAAFSGHSLRSGFATTAAEAGADTLSIASVTGHVSMEMVKRYAKTADKLKISPFRVRGVGLGDE